MGRINDCASVVCCCVEALCVALKFFIALVVAAIVVFVLLLLVVGLLATYLVHLLGPRRALELLLAAAVAVLVLRACSGTSEAGGPGASAGASWRSPLARFVAHKAVSLKCVARWCLQRLQAHLPIRLLAAASWVASCALAAAGRPDTAGLLILAGAALTRAVLISPMWDAAAASVDAGGLSRQPLFAGRPPAVPAAQLWDLFFEACRAAGAELLRREARGGRRWLTEAELQELGPQLLVGLPALALLRTALRGAATDRGRCAEWSLLLCSGQVLTAEGVPQSPAALEAFRWLLEAQDALRGAGLHPGDLSVLEGLVLWEGDLRGEGALAPGDDVEGRADLRVRGALFSSALVPAGTRGVVERVVRGRQEAWVRWAQGRCLVPELQLLKVGADRPKPLEAVPPPEAEARMPKLRLAAGRVRGAAMALSATSTFVGHFQRRVVDPLLEGAQPPPPPSSPDFRWPDGGGAMWRSAGGFNGLALGLAVAVSRARSQPVGVPF